MSQQITGSWQWVDTETGQPLKLAEGELSGLISLRITSDGEDVLEAESIKSKEIADLIAAAPELLEALEGILHHFVPRQGNLKVEDAMIKKAEAVIHKAKGIEK